MSARPPGSRVTNIAVAVAATLLGLLVLEAAFRMSQGVAVLSRQNYLLNHLDLIRANGGVVLHDPLLGWRLVDNYKGGKGLTTGPHGLRMSSEEIRPLPGPGALVAVGDSFTVGSGVNNDESWPAVLEQKLGKTILNGASGAWAVDQMVLRAEQLAEIAKPSVILVGILGQDSLRNNFRIYGGGHKPMFLIKNGKLELTNIPTPKLDAQPTKLGLWRSLLGHSYAVHTAMMRMSPSFWANDRYRYDQVHKDKVGVEITCLLMDRLKALGEKHKSRVIVVTLYGAGEIDMPEAPWYGPPVAKCAKERGLEALDVYDPLKQIAKSDRARFVSLWLNEGGQLGHMSAPGNALIADLVHKAFFAK